MRYRFRLLQGLLAVGFGAVALRLGYLQLWRHKDFAARVDQQARRVVARPPGRGPILDRNGRPLAESVRAASCYADPTILSDPTEAARRLSPLLERPASFLFRRIQRAPGAFVRLRRSLPVEKAEQVEAERIPGVGVQWEYERAYPDGELARPLIGRVGVDGRGLSGLEHLFDAWLTDARAPSTALKDGRGAGVALPSDGGQGPEPWLRLTLDRVVQFIAERELDVALARSRGRMAMAVVQDPWTGEILALASRSSDGDSSILPAQWTFEPGSTMKVVTAAAALEAKRAGPYEVFDCEEGHWRVAGLELNDHDPHGPLTLTRMMEVSSNIGLAKVGMRVGAEGMHRCLQSFGFGARTGSELPGESPGILRPVSQWSGASLPVVSFGQEVGVTAMQLAGAYSALANGGILYEPKLFQSAQNQAGERRAWPASRVVRRVVSAETAGAVAAMLRRVVSDGTGTGAALDGWTAAGKTGTAQKIDPATRAYSRDKYVASFCGFVPALKPRLTIVVVVDEPAGSYWGGSVAAPVFREIARHALTTLGVPPDKPASPASLTLARRKEE